MTNNAPAGWYNDPDDPTSLRWWDGDAWSDQRAPAPGVPVAPASAARTPISARAWLWIAGAAAGFLLLAIIVGIGRAMILIAVAAIVLAIIALAGRRVPLLRSLAWKLGALGAGMVLLIGGTAASAATSPRSPTALADLPAATSAPRETPTPTPTPTPVVTTRQVVVTEAVAFERTSQDDAGRDVGSSAVVQVGVDGTRTITYTVTYVDGVETDRVVASDEITVAAVPEITAVGTRQPPPAPVAGGGSGCDPNYGGCVPIASDVDCAGGSGNGPAYVSGPVQVIGTDIYDLDRDGNGWGCD